jgi:hypothetical protein
MKPYYNSDPLPADWLGLITNKTHIDSYRKVNEKQATKKTSFQKHKASKDTINLNSIDLQEEE